MTNFSSAADDSSNYDLPQFETRLRRARLGLGVGVVGIVMVFVSFASAYVVRQGLPTLDPSTNTLVHDWFPLPLPWLLFFNTGVLLISSLTMELARREVARNIAPARVVSIPVVSAVQERTIFWLAFTLLLGLAFLRGQWIVWRELAASGFYVATFPSSSFVYLLTGMHSLHLLGGVLALLVAASTSLLPGPVESRVVVVDVTGWYWHFMALLWVCILCLLTFLR